MVSSSHKRTVVFVLEDILGVVLGLSRGVWVVEVGLVTADDLSFRRHFGYRDAAVSGWSIDRFSVQTRVA